MEVTLIVIRGKVSRGEIDFHPPAVLGRSREADLTIAHPMISRQHCELYEVDGLLMVRDLGSLNGTMVRDRRVVEAPLCPNDSFSIGPVSFQVQYQHDGDRTAIPSPKWAEAADGEVATEVVPTDEQAPAGMPIFSEITPEPAYSPPAGDGPWADAVPDADDGPWANAMPADDEKVDAGGDNPKLDFAAGVESGGDAEPVADALAEKQPGDMGPWSGGADVQSEPPDEMPCEEEQRGEAVRAPGGKKRGWKLWPFGGKKASKAEMKEATPAVEDLAPVAASAEESGQGHHVTDTPPVPPEDRFDPEGAVANFLPDDANEPEEPALPQPDGGSESDGGDTAFQDFLKGL